MTIAIAGSLKRLSVPDDELSIGQPRWQKQMFAHGTGGTGLRLKSISKGPPSKLDIAGRCVTGYAATWAADLVGDQIVKGAFAKTILDRGPFIEDDGRLRSKIKLCNEHFKVIGLPYLMREDNFGLWVEALISLTSEGKDCIEMLRDGTIDSLSIGYDVINADFDDKRALRILRELKLYEFSLVANPANEKARVAELKTMEDIMDKQQVINVFGTLEKAAVSIAASADKLSASIEAAEQKSLTLTTEVKQVGAEASGGEAAHVDATGASVVHPAANAGTCPNCGEKGDGKVGQVHPDGIHFCQTCGKLSSPQPKLPAGYTYAAEVAKSMPARLGSMAVEIKSLGTTEYKAHAHTMDAASRLTQAAHTLMEKSNAYAPWHDGPKDDPDKDGPPDAEKVKHVVDILADTAENLQKHCMAPSATEGKKSYAWKQDEERSVKSIIDTAVGRLQALLGEPLTDASLDEVATALAAMRIRTAKF